MYSVKPGRGPSLLGAIMAGVVALFGVLWTVGATAAGAPPFLTLFGIIFVVFAVVGGVFSLYNAAGRNRFSSFDITTDREESDPMTEALDLTEPDGEKRGQQPAGPRRFAGGYCPYCGAGVEPDFDYCPKCGKDI